MKRPLLLPAELRRHIFQMEGEAGFEPAIVGLQPIAFATWLLALVFGAPSRNRTPRIRFWRPNWSRTTVQNGRSGVIRTLTGPGLNRVPLPVGLRSCVFGGALRNRTAYLESDGFTARVSSH